MDLFFLYGQQTEREDRRTEMCVRTQVACASAQLLVPTSPCGQEAIPPPPEVGGLLANCYELAQVRWESVRRIPPQSDPVPVSSCGSASSTSWPYCASPNRPPCRPLHRREKCDDYASPCAASY